MSEADRYSRLLKKRQENNDKKIRLEERLKSAKGELKKVVQEIQDAGFDHKTLKEDLAAKREELTTELDKFEKDVNELEEALEAIEG